MENLERLFNSFKNHCFKYSMHTMHAFISKEKMLKNQSSKIGTTP